MSVCYFGVQAYKRASEELKELSSNVLNQCEKKPKVEDSLKPHVVPIEPEACSVSTRSYFKTRPCLFCHFWHELWKCNQLYHKLQLWTLYLCICWALSCLHQQGFFCVLLITTRYLTRPLLSLLLVITIVRDFWARIL